MADAHALMKDCATLCILFGMRKNRFGSYFMNGCEVVLLNNGEAMLYWSPSSSAHVRCSSPEFLLGMLEKEFGPLPPQIVDMDGIIGGR